MNRQNYWFIKLFWASLLFLVYGAANANGTFSNDSKLNRQTLHFKGTNSQTGNSIDLTMSLGKFIQPLDIYQLIIKKVIISNSKQQCIIIDSNNNSGSINLESVNLQPFSWKGNYGKVSGLLNINGGSYVKWGYLGSSKCNISADQIIIQPVQ